MKQSLIADQLRKSYRQTWVVDKASLEVEQGSIVGLLGPNGAGKTTCFYIIAGLINADSGKVYLSSDNSKVDISGLPMHKRGRLGIGYLPQEASIFKKLTVEQNIMAVLQLRKGLSKQQRVDKLEQLLQEVNIERIRKSKGMSVSGGERRRVEVARALAMDPKFILLDEPFAGVDPVSVKGIQDIILHLKERDIGVLITDHNVREALRLCDKCYIIDQGQMITDGDANAILSHERVRSAYLGKDFKM